jgi:Lrp/AsnC family transcriptional regulator, leucine-responsive regulatory protein
VNPPSKAPPRPLDLDSLDTQLLALLEMDGRMSLSRLARQVGRSRSAIQERVQRLEQAGYIGGYTIRRGGPAVGVRAFLLISGTAGDHEEIAAALRRFPEVRRCDSVSGAVDIVVQVQAPDIDSVERVCKAVGALRGVEKTITLFVMDARIHRP